MKNAMKNFYGIAMTIYGSFATVLIGWMFILDDIYVTERLEMFIVITGFPALIHGLNYLRKLWIKDTISKKDKEIEEIKKDCQLTIIDAA